MLLSYICILIACNAELICLDYVVWYLMSILMCIYLYVYVHFEEIGR